MNTPSHSRDDLLELADDYAHGTLTAADGARLEAILAASPEARREFVDYCMLHGQIALSTLAAGPRDPHGRPNRRRTAGFPFLGRAAAVLAGLALSAASLAVVVGLVLRNPAASQAAGTYYDNRQLPLVTVASMEVAGEAPAPIHPTTLRSEKAIGLRSASGAEVSVAGATVFGFMAADSGTLYRGSVQARLVEPDASFSVTAANMRVVDKGTAFRVTRIDDDHVDVSVLDGEVEVQSRVRLPICYWTFDEPAAAGGGSGFADLVGGLVVIPGGGARPVPGLVGRGAIAFDDTASAVGGVVGGTGDEVGTGRFAMAEGITLEAVIVSQWQAQVLNYESIFRKEDGDCRILLAFQNDGPNFGGVSEPDLPAGPRLAFGVHLAGRGYRELEMPLDGVDGRPTVAEIADGRPHHVVATYDSYSGRKAIFIDGRKRFEHVYPVGTLIRSGGPQPAEIGNYRGWEPFRGTIDEFAVYDFALTPAEIEQHHARVLAGETYFGSEPPAADGPRWQAITRLVEGQSQVFNQSTGLPR